MSKVIAALALSAGGAATYIWFRKHGSTSHLESRIDRAVNKVRGAFANDDTRNEMAAKVQDTAHDVLGNVAERVGAANSEQ